MHASTLITLAASITLASAQNPLNGYPVPGVTGQLGDAAITQNNPIGVTYTATLPDSPTSGIRGFISGTSGANGTGVQFNVNFFGFPDASLGPFIYHVHDQPVPADGNCTATLAHQDPYVRGEKPPCDPTQPQTCQTGDLAGKHGNITTNPFTVSYLDLYESTAAGIGAFFGNRSVVVHTSNATRLNCANFTLTSGNSSSGGSNNNTGGGSGTGNGTVAGQPSPVPFTGAAAAKAVASVGAVLLGLAAFALM